MSQSLNVLAVVRPDGEKYVFLFDETIQSCDRLLVVLDEFAENPELTFTFEEAEMIGERVKAIAQEYKRELSED